MTHELTGPDPEDKSHVEFAWTLQLPRFWMKMASLHEGLCDDGPSLVLSAYLYLKTN